MSKCYKLLFIILAIILSNCTTIDNDGNTSTNPNDLGKKSSLSLDDIEECRLYQSYQYDYWKNRNYRRVIYCNMYMILLEDQGIDGKKLDVGIQIDNLLKKMHGTLGILIYHLING